jgi:hypothetical protein
MQIWRQKQREWKKEFQAEAQNSIEKLLPGCCALLRKSPTV